jgi:glycine cleavage system aminomethyltransferase T
VTYTSLLDERGGVKADLTVMRLGTNHFRFVTGGGVGMADKKWIGDHLPDDGSAQLVDLTSAWSTIGLWGPKARDVLECITPDDVSDPGFGFGTCRALEVDGISVLASRISYVGELGWELHVPMEQAARLWDAVWDAGQAYALVPVGIGVYGTTGRLEKSYRAYGNDLIPDFNLVEAGMARPSVKKQEFIGKGAYLAQRERSPAALLCTLTVEEHQGPDGPRHYPLGGEPILTTTGEPLVDARRRRSYVTSAGSGPSVGKHLLLSYLPAELAVEGKDYIAECMGEPIAIRVAVVGSAPLYDPANQRIRA